MQFAKAITCSIVCAILTACGSGSDNNASTNVSYAANISSDTSETGVQLLRITELAGGERIVEVVNTMYLGYGVGMFFSDQGSVPNTQKNIPQECHNTATLGLDSAMKCWGEPTLDLVNSMLTNSGLSKSEVVVISDVSSSLQPFANGESDAIEQSPTASDDFFNSFDGLAESKGFDSSIVIDE